MHEQQQNKQKQKDFNNKKREIYTRQSNQAVSMENLKFKDAKLNDMLKYQQAKHSNNIYNLKYDFIYGDHKLKISGKNEISRLSSDLKNINRMLNVEKALAKSSPSLSALSKPRDSRSFKKSTRKNISVLDLSAERETCLSFPLLQIPVELFQMDQLVRLHLDCNNIKCIPDELGFRMKNLEILTLSNNYIKWLPMSLSNLKHMKSIHLSHNKFDLFPFVLCYLHTLRFIDISSNYLLDVPCEIENLKQLESLLLFQNNLQSIPKSIGNLNSLRTLWLGSNELLRLPVDICDIVDLDWTPDNFDLSSNIDKNPLIDPPLDVCLKGIQSIRDYFEKKYEESMRLALSDTGIVSIAEADA